MANLNRQETFTRKDRAVIFGILSFFTLMEAPSAFYQIFRGFAPYDDEGYLMITIRQLLDGHPLYTRVFSEYGPCYYLFHCIVYGIAHVPVSNDAQRLISLVTWLLIAFLYGYSAYRATGSIVFSALAQFAVFVLARITVFEPGHPAGLCAALQGGGFLLCCYVKEGRRRGLALAGVGMIFAALLLTKINVGVFFGLAIGIAMLAFCEGRNARALWLTSAIVGIFVPFILTSRLFYNPWARNYAIIVGASFLSVMLSARNRMTETFRWKDYAIVSGSALGSGLIISSFVFLRGTSPRMLLDGILLLPWHSVGEFVRPAETSDAGVACGVLGLLLAAIYAWKCGDAAQPPRRLTDVILLAKGTFGCCVILLILTYVRSATFFSAALENFGTPFVFLMVLPGAEKSGGRESFFRVAWPLLAVFQVLEGYPVARTDAVFSVVPIVVVACVCLSDCVHAIAARLAEVTITGRVQKVGTAVVIILLLVANTAVAVIQHRLYWSNRALDLPGAAWVRLPAVEAEGYRRLVTDLDENADVFLSLPGMNSFYFWAKQEPPTTRNLGHWLQTLSDDEQQQIIDALEQHPRSAILYAPELVGFWITGNGNRLPRTALYRYIFDHFQTVDRVPIAGEMMNISYQFMLRKDRASAVVRSTRLDDRHP